MGDFIETQSGLNVIAVFRIFFSLLLYIPLKYSIELIIRICDIERVNNVLYQSQEMQHAIEFNKLATKRIALTDGYA